MRIAVIADVHGILPALEAFLDGIAGERLDGLIVAGDMVGGPSSVAVLDRLRNHRPWMIRGNWENYLLRLAAGDAPDWWQTRNQYAFMRWNYENVDSVSLGFLRGLPEQARIDLPQGDAIRVVHGSPGSVNELIFPGRNMAQLDRALAQVSENVVIFGHTHEAWVLERNGRLALNPGSLGMSFDGQQCGTYALLDWDGQAWSAEIRRLDYDFGQLRQAYETSGLLEKGGAISRCCLTSIEQGINHLPPLLEYAYKQAALAGYADLPFVPDEIWDEATRTFEQKNY